MNDKTDIATLTAQIITAHVGRNPTDSASLPALINSVYRSLSGLSSVGMAEVLEPVGIRAAAEPPSLPGAPAQLVQPIAHPAVPIAKSVFPDHLICLDCGGRFKALKRHIGAEHGLTPEGYRGKWGLPWDYPMVAPEYAEARSVMAKQLGLGRRRVAAPVVPGEVKRGPGRPPKVRPEPEHEIAQEAEAEVEVPSFAAPPDDSQPLFRATAKPQKAKRVPPTPKFVQKGASIKGNARYGSSKGR